MPARRCSGRPRTSRRRTRTKDLPKRSSSLSCRESRLWPRRPWRSNRQPRMLLVGDIGGTKTDLALVSVSDGPRAPIARKRFLSADYPSLEHIAREFLEQVDVPVTHSLFAVAGPVVSGRSVLTNLPWVIQETALQATLQLESVRVVNDVEAMAAAVPYLQPTDVLAIQAGE